MIPRKLKIGARPGSHVRDAFVAKPQPSAGPSATLSATTIGKFSVIVSTILCCHGVPPTIVNTTPNLRVSNCPTLSSQNFCGIFPYRKKATKGKKCSRFCSGFCPLSNSSNPGVHCDIITYKILNVKSDKIMN